MDAQNRRTVNALLSRWDDLISATPLDEQSLFSIGLDLIERLRYFDPLRAYRIALNLISYLPVNPVERSAANALQVYIYSGHLLCRLGDPAAAYARFADAITVLNANPGLDSTSVRADLCHLQGTLSMHDGRHRQALSKFLRALQYARQLQHISLQVGVLLTLSRCFARCGRPDRARDTLRFAMRIDPRGTAHPHHRILLYNDLAWTYYHHGDIEEAQRLIEIAIGIAHAYDDRIGIGITHGTLGHFLTIRQAYPTALEHFELAYELLSGAGDRSAMTRVRSGWSKALHAAGTREAAQFSRDHANVMPAVDSMAGP